MEGHTAVSSDAFPRIALANVGLWFLSSCQLTVWCEAGQDHHFDWIIIRVRYGPFHTEGICSGVREYRTDEVRLLQLSTYMRSFLLRFQLLVDCVIGCGTR